ncbi:MAG: translocation/assembly module TamB domain-containing protein [Muribaculaceae bacterium]|nr:translocation/assembly module TamB domain-containing protein [Muribaculaceae bacterium]
MKPVTVIRKIFKVLSLTIMAVVLLVVGTILALYSPWLQESLRSRIVEQMNRHEGVTMTLDRFKVGFPLDLTLSGLSLVQQGDTVIAASELTASVSLWPLLKGEAKVSEIKLSDGRFVMGAPDSAMYMVVNARSLDLQPVSVRLENMAIDIEQGMLDGVTVDMVISPDTAAVATPPSDPSEMSIRLGRLGLKDFTYNMRLLPAIDSLGTTIADGVLADGMIDLMAQTVRLKEFTGSGLAAAYIAPDSATVAATPVVETSDSIASAPWTIEIDSIAFTGSKALYTTRGLSPTPGLDFAYIAVDSLDLSVSNFYDQATTLRLPLKLSGTERCGVRLNVDGTFALDSAAMYLKDFKINTETTDLDVDMLMGMGDLMGDPSLPIKLDADGGVGIADLRKMFPAFLPYLVTIPAQNQLGLGIALDGTMGRLDIDRLALTLNGCVSIKGNGYVGNLTDMNNIFGDIALSGNVINLNGVKNSIMGKEAGKEFNIPRMALNGHVNMRSGNVNGNVKIKTGSGQLALNGNWNSRGESYKANLDVKDFPIQTFMPNLGAADVTASLQAAGKGYNPFDSTMTTDAKLEVKSAQYADYIYRDIFANVNLAHGKGHLDLHSDNPDTDIRLTADGNLSTLPYDWTLNASGDDIDLLALKMADLETTLSFSLSGNASVDPKSNVINASLKLNDFDFVQPASHITVSNVLANLSANDSVTDLSLNNRDLTAHFSSPCSLDSLMARFTATSDVLNRQIAAKIYNVEEIQAAMPKFDLDMRAGTNNALNDILLSKKMNFKKIDITASNDSTFNLDSKMLRFITGTTRLDTIAFDVTQEGEFLVFNGKVENQPGTFDSWAHVNLGGYFIHNEVGLRFRQSNISGKQGFDVGMKASLEDSVATLRMTPIDQVIGYQDWKVNKDNFISYNIVTRHIDANLVMNGGGSQLSILTQHVPGSEDQEDLNIALTDIHIADWVSINPFAPPISGDVTADITLRQVDGNLNGVGDVIIDKFFYGKEKVGDFKMDFDVTTRPGGTLYAKSDIYVDGLKTMTLAGALNDSTSTSPYNLDFSMIRFPLATVNPFLPPRMAKLRGVLNGTMRISGDEKAPIFNGFIDFDSTAIFLNMTGTEYEFSDVKIPVVDNLVSFDKFSIKGVNDNPLMIDGTVDISSMASPKIDLRMNANNMQLVNSNRTRKGSDIYGKAFISLDSRVHGDMKLLFVNADLRIMPPTNVTYVIPDATNVIASQSTGDMVKFVNFTDSTAVMMADSITESSMGLILDASLTIENGTTIGVNLSSDGKNRAQIEADGTVNYTMSPISDGRMTGRLNINQGYVRYSPPLMSEKNFAFDDNSYIAFNGDVMNPTLNIHATDVIKANVTQSGQNSRLVDFDVMLNVTGSLDRMDVAFDLSTEDDVTVANELQSMSPDQRANQAMNMLLYGIYTGPGTKGDASITGNALYSFLESQLNSWMANNVKGVDISFGINQYDRTIDGSSSQTTSYSYQVSKSLFNDRFKIVIGGNYSTDADADENFSQNLINDISFDYYLNKGHTMYVRIFRHTGYESILEGEITQTGVGFVYRKKLNHLVDMFKFLRPRRSKKK